MAIRGMPDFTPHVRHEQPRDALEVWSEANWAQVPELIRKDVEEHLRLQLLEHAPEVLAKWKDQHARGICIGSDDPMFHFGVGRTVRNVCRDQLTDGELPTVIRDHAGRLYGPSRNWDDYYFGVLAAIAA